ncbi:hypothetical protein D3C74_385320 [compost metagenome]
MPVTAASKIVPPLNLLRSTTNPIVSNVRPRSEKNHEALGSFLGLLVPVKSSNVRLFPININVKSEMQKNNNRNAPIVIRIAFTGK